MNFNVVNEIEKNGFIGFKTIEQLIMDESCLPKIKGVYMILNISKKESSFLEVGSGGHFKDKNPNVSIEELKKNWIPNTVVIYIGKAGGDESSATLNSRLKQYFKFGQNKNVGHWGGRYIWQLEKATELLVCWKPLPNQDPRTFEIQLLNEFKQQYNNLPFANLTN